MEKGGETRAKDKERSPQGLVYGGTSAIFRLQTEPLNTLTEQQQRLFKTQRYFGAGSVFSAWPKGWIRQTFLLGFSAK